MTDMGRLLYKIEWGFASFKADQFKSWILIYSIPDTKYICILKLKSLTDVLLSLPAAAHPWLVCSKFKVVLLFTRQNSNTFFPK